MPYIELKTGTKVPITQDQCRQFTSKPIVYPMKQHTIGLPGGMVRVTEADVAAVFIDSEVPNSKAALLEAMGEPTTICHIALGKSSAEQHTGDRLEGKEVEGPSEEKLKSVDAEKATKHRKKPGPKAKGKKKLAELPAPELAKLHNEVKG